MTWLTSDLFVRDADDKPVERISHLDLAREPARGPDVEGEVEHILLHLLGLPGRLAPCVVDIDMASRASARAAALCRNARDRILHRGFHDCHAGLGLDAALGPVVLNKGDPG